MKQLVTGADIGIYDATNSSTERRAWLRESVEAHAQLLGLKYKCALDVCVLA